TEIAREALQAVITERGFSVRLKLEPPVPSQPEDEDLVIFCWPRSLEKADRMMKALAAAGIPSFLSLEVWADDLKRADPALYRAIDAESEKNDPEEKKEYAILCPKCRSAKVVLKGRTSKLEASSLAVKFRWICDACGHQWMDDGWVQEVDGGQSWPGEEFPAPSEEWDPK
ncbi:MAG TPA: hypothetical protein VHW72_03025, partial [Candidatus Angelobacter sp.]|nr:hypothetical protein [Candidatus Angelobacter sp.]